MKNQIFGNIKPIEQYWMRASETRKKLSSACGNELTFSKAIIYDDVNNNGEEVMLLAIMTDDGAIYASNSRTAVRSLSGMLETFNGCDSITVMVKDNVAHSGRHYTTLELVKVLPEDFGK